MQLKDWLISSTKLLFEAGIDSPRLDCLILLGDELNKDRAWLLARPEYELSPQQVASLKKLLTRRTSHEPLAYIRGKVEFYGRSFMVNHDVLVPRPESETMIELLLEIYPDLVGTLPNLSAQEDSPQAVRIADVGTGSGCLGITAKLELPNSPKNVIDLIDIDETALEVAKSNVDLLTSDNITLQGDLISDTPTNYDLLLCNLPYVPDEYPINTAASHEPSLALFSGKDGLNHYRKLFKQLSGLSDKPLYLLIESLEHQQPKIEEMALKYGYKLDKKRDLITVFKLST